MIKKIAVLVMALALSVSLMACSSQGGKAYPDGNVTVLCNRGAGGGSDVNARFMAAELEKELDVNFTVLNKTGGDGVIGLNELTKAKADGYTLMVVADGEIPNSIVNGEGVEFTYEDFDYIGSFNVRSDIVAAKPGSPFATLDDLVAYAKDHPGELTIGVAAGSKIKMAESFMDALGIELTIVNPGGGNEMFAQLLGGHIDLAMPGIQFYSNLMEEKGVALAQTASTRENGLADVPTVMELGYDMMHEEKMLLVGPKGMPEEVTTTLRNTMDKLYSQEEFAQGIKDIGEVPLFPTKEEFEAYVGTFFEKAVGEYEASKARQNG